MKLRAFAGSNYTFDSNKEGKLDLTGTKVTNFYYTKTQPNKVILPDSCVSIVIDDANNSEFVFNKSVSVGINGSHFRQNTIDMLLNNGLTNAVLSMPVDSDLNLGRLVGSCRYILVCYVNASNPRYRVNLESVENFTTLKELVLTGRGGIDGVYNIGRFDLNRLSLVDCNITNISWITSLTDLKYLNLSNNNITNVSGLGGLENIGKSSEDFPVNSSDCFYLNHNSISDITPLALAIGDDGVINYKSLDISYNSLDGSTVADNVGALLKLHRAGLEKVTITGNNFTGNEIQELINGKTIDGEVYTGFGEGNVIN